MKYTKWIFMLCFLLCCLQNRAQAFTKFPISSSTKLIAANQSRKHAYFNGNNLKIYYHLNGQIIKAKGSLLIDSNRTIELISYGKKPFAVINTDSITGIRKWHREGKKTLIELALAGTAVAVVGGLSSRNTTEGVRDNPVSLLLFIGAAVDAYTLVIATPIVFVSEWLSLRSERNGYHFYIE